MAACRMASKGKSMADSGYDAEVKSIQAFLSMQVIFKTWIMLNLVQIEFHHKTKYKLVLFIARLSYISSVISASGEPARYKPELPWY